ncbi:hypothetical protein IHV21_20470 [Acinetobacter baumannii]|uniref:hypothetical protein n=1 Tax=Acinetobacter baumannii TaxID=470 RepID=UPI00186B9A91|nr:hypothetical protein [Acinetobacter baumannii]MBE4724575.1 hypothetical protein [Acinetobacter baumannii]
MSNSLENSLFGQALKAGLQASENKSKNLSSINEVIEKLKLEISQATDNKISIQYKSPAKRNPLAAFGVLGSALSSLEINEKPKDEKPKDKAIYAVNSEGDEELLSIVEIGSEGYPCTIFLDGNKLIALDKMSFESNLSELISSATIGDKFQRLLNALNNE